MFLSVRIVLDFMNSKLTPFWSFAILVDRLLLSTETTEQNRDLESIHTKQSEFDITLGPFFKGPNREMFMTGGISHLTSAQLSMCFTCSSQKWRQKAPKTRQKLRWLQYRPGRAWLGKIASLCSCRWIVDFAQFSNFRRFATKYMWKLSVVCTVASWFYAWLPFFS